MYNTTTLNRTVRDLKRTSAFLLGLFFGAIEVSDTEDIKFDVETGKRRISPFVSPLKEGKVVESLGYKTNSFSPAYVKDKRVHNPLKAFKRTAGEKIGGELTPEQRRQANLAKDLTDQQEMLVRRKEVMASEVLRTGSCTITGDDYDTVVVNFGRNAAHTVVLAPGSKWSDAGIDPLEDIENWRLTVLKNSGAAPTIAVFDVDAWRFFRESATFDKLVDKRALSEAQEIKYMAIIEAGGVFQGRIGNLTLWLYSDWYVNEAGVEVPILPSRTVLLGSAAIEGVQHHGAIKDDDALFPAESFTKSWKVEDPSVRYLLMQSAPLVVPYRPDASFCATV
jgi:hypothetical protein